MGKHAWALLLIVAILFGLGQTAQAHGSGVVAIVSFGAGTPKPGETATVTIRLVDAYGAPLTGMQTRAVVASQAKPLPQPDPLQETQPGVYTGDLPFPAAGPAFFSMESDLPDGLWYALLPFQVGSSDGDVHGMMLNLIHADDLTGSRAQPSPPSQAAPPPPTPFANWLPKLSWLGLGVGLGLVLDRLLLARRRR